LTTSAISFPAALKAARRVSTPLIAVRTFDPASALQALTCSLPKGDPAPVVRWDIMRGIGAANECARAIVAQLLNGQNPDSIGPPDALALALRLPEDAMLVTYNFHRFWNDPAVVQGVWNLRDVFKADGRALLMLASPGARLPEELVQDVLVLDQPLPSQEELEQIVRDTFLSAEKEEPAASGLRCAVDAVIGLASFPAEQVLAMSMTKSGLSYDQLWERKRQVIAQTPGLSVWRGGETFEDIGGCTT
jgi:hypothetical protein